MFVRSILENLQTQRAATEHVGITKGSFHDLQVAVAAATEPKAQWLLRCFAAKIWFQVPHVIFLYINLVPYHFEIYWRIHKYPLAKRPGDDVRKILQDIIGVPIDHGLSI